jgi:transposase-like protein
VKRKRYSRKFQRMAVERMRSSDNIGDLAKELGVGRRCLYKWQANLDHLEPGERAPWTNSHESSYRQPVHRLNRLLAEKTLELNFFNGALQKVKARRPEERRLWRDGIYDQTRGSDATAIPRVACWLGQS